MQDDFTREDVAASMQQLDAVLEMHPGGAISYDVVNGLVLEESTADPDFKDAGQRVKDMRLFGMLWVEDGEYFVTPAYDEDAIWSSEVRCVVPWSVLVSESNADWWDRLGEIQLHMQMAERPVGFKHTIYPDVK